MLLKYFYNDKLAQASYLVGCQATGEALVIDPSRAVNLYLQAAAEHGMQLVATTETHIHADFISGSRQLAAQAGVKLYLSDEGDAAWKYQYEKAYDHELLYEGSTFMIGNIKVEVMHTPGHTPEHISFIITDTAGASEPMGIFTGDFVFVGDVGRPDLLEEAAHIAGSADPSARRMFHSLQRFKQLPDYLQLWPAHGAGSACGKALGAIPSSTVGYEKRFNGLLQIDDEDEFVKRLLAGQPEAPKYFAMMKQLNKVGPPVLNGPLTAPALTLADLTPLLKTGAKIVDVRSVDAFAQNHIPGTINIPAAKSFTNWAGWLLDFESPFYLIAAPETASSTLQDLASIGLDNVGGVFSLDIFDAWREAGHPLQRYARMPANAVADKVKQGEITVVDVRAISEWEQGHIPGAQHHMLGYLPERAADIPTTKPILVNCRSGVRSAIGVSVLQAKGFPNVINLEGGYLDWARSGLPVER